jgi:hypothetical protein
LALTTILRGWFVTAERLVGARSAVAERLVGAFSSISSSPDTGHNTGTLALYADFTDVSTKGRGNRFRPGKPGCGFERGKLFRRAGR